MCSRCMCSRYICNRFLNFIFNISSIQIMLSMLQVRLMMKQHAFVRHNIPRALSYDKKKGKMEANSSISPI